MQYDYFEAKYLSIMQEFKEDEDGMLENVLPINLFELHTRILNKLIETKTEIRKLIEEEERLEILLEDFLKDNVVLIENEEKAREEWERIDKAERAAKRKRRKDLVKREIAKRGLLIEEIERLRK